VPIDSVDFLKKHQDGCRVFVETGSRQGNTIVKALAIFDEVHSVELLLEYHTKCLERFNESENVHLYCGDSAEIFPRMMDGINDRCLLWLDAHNADRKACPLLDELRYLRRHPHRHVILIDDTQYFGNFLPTVEEIMQAIKSIDKRYKFDVDTASSQYKNGVMIAKVEDG